MPIVKIELFPGRSRALKNEIAQRITQMFEDVAGVVPKDTTVIFEEVERYNWFLGGVPFGDGPPKTE